MSTGHQGALLPDARARQYTDWPTLLARTHAEGHVLGLHSGSARGHLDHRRMPPEELQRSLEDGVLDLTALSGRAPTLVRPTFWSWDARTRAAYEAHGLAMLLTDISARDGKIYGWTISLRRRSHFRAGLDRVRTRATALPTRAGVLPVVVTFHDTNTFTASHLQEYLHILLEESRQVGLPVAVGLTMTPRRSKGGTLGPSRGLRGTAVTTTLRP
jgi:peptidoglycan/xylan/chitin deacetylase (PgdA/CDA1 family)